MDYTGRQSDRYCGMDYFCDGVIKTDDDSCFNIHRIILSGCSEYFRALFLHSHQKEISINGFCSTTMRQVLQYIYTKEVVIDPSTVTGLLIAADYFLLDDLLEKCKILATTDMNLTNCMDLYIASHIIQHLGISHSVQRYVCIHFKDLVGHQDNLLQDLPLEIFKSLLRDNNLHVSNEITVWAAIRQWVKPQPQRLADVPGLILCLYFNSSSNVGDLLANILGDEIVKDNPHCKSISKVMEEFANNPSDSNTSNVLLENLSQLYPGECQEGLRQPKKIYLIVKNGFKNGFHTRLASVYLTFDSDLYFRRKICSKCDFGPTHVFNIRRMTYMFDTWSGEASVFDCVTDSWEEMPRMNWTRSNFSVVKVGDSIYAVGGRIHDLEDLEDTMAIAIERYDHRRGLWEVLGYTACNTVAAAFEGKIYTVSEHFTGDILLAVYDAASEKWTELPSPTLIRVDFKLIVHKDLLFFIGGLSDSGTLKVVEVYEPQTNKWEKLMYLPFRYANLEAKVVEDLLVVFDEGHEYPPVVLDETLSTWLPLHSWCVPFIENWVVCSVDDVETISLLKRKNGMADAKWKSYPPFTCMLSSSDA